MTRSSASSITASSTYEQRLRTDPAWAMSESARFFDGASMLQTTLRKLASKLDDLGVPYVVIGGVALTAHGYARMTEDIDVLVTKESLKAIHQALIGLGYRREFSGSKNIRDTDTSVKIEFVLAGDYPGSGDVQPVCFPEPAQVRYVEQDGVKFAGLEVLIELKLASGMTGGPDRAKDLIDVQQLIAKLALNRDFAARLHEHVRPKFHELWDGLQATPRKYIRLWRNKFLTLDAESMEDMIEILGAAADELRRMMADGIVLDPEGGTRDDYAMMVTTDPAIARKYDMHEESEFFGEPE